MGKSPPSCFKIISCGSDSVDNDDLQTPENKGSSDRRRWSFRKRSARDRVLSNSVSSEAPSSENKENPESPAINFQVQPDSTVPKKTSVIQSTEEKTELPVQLDSKLFGTLPVVDDNCKSDATRDEPNIIIIQTAIRSLLARQVLLKHKNIIKLQAAVRGHIVRTHAAGTLRCVQSIIRMQALVRARLAGRLDKGSGDSENPSESGGKDHNDLNLLRKKEVNLNVTYTYVSIEKLLSNAFARQLMESTPRTKPINIKCDPSKSDSAWKWLERWMSVSSVSGEGSQQSESTEEHHTERVEHSSGKQDILVPSDYYAESPDLTSKNHDNMLSRDISTLDLDSGEKSISSSSDLSNLHDVDQLNSTCDEMKETDFIEVVEVKSLPEKDEIGNEPDIPNPKYISSEQSETEVKKLSRKSGNPAFIAAQSKFEELSSVATSPKLTSSLSHGLEIESDQPVKYTDVGLADNAIFTAAPALQIGSECGTELSISSTLDSPDRSVNDIEQEAEVSEATKHPKSGEKFLELAAEEKSPTQKTDPSFANTNDSEKSGRINSAYAEEKQEAELESEASPRSHITVPESQATPSSQISVKPKKRKGGKKDSSNRKNQSSSAEKNCNQDSVRSSLEQLPENKTGKRRNSFGLAKPDNKEQELRDISSGNYVPSYMQATECAKAKAIANGSPRSSPDVHDKDIYIKKRHSLPGMNERQVSPRIHRSSSQAQQIAKGNASHSPQDRKWRR